MCYGLKSGKITLDRSFSIDKKVDIRRSNHIHWIEEGEGILKRQESESSS